MCVCVYCVPAEELKNLKARVDRLEGVGETRVSAGRLQASGNVNIIDPPVDGRDPSLGRLGPEVLPSGVVTLQDVKQLLQSELQSDTMRGE